MDKAEIEHHLKAIRIQAEKSMNEAEHLLIMVKYLEEIL